MARHRIYRRTGRYLFVDGYNIINYWSDFEGLVEEHLEEARTLLADMLEEYAATEDIHVILVFDAYRVKGNGGSLEKKEHMDIVFTKETVTADRYIESEIASMGRVRDVTVATSDYVEQQIIMARGGKRISARELQMLVKRSKTVTRKEANRIRTKKGAPLVIDEENKKKLEDLRQQLDPP
ncbi:MAG: NYN domain-containing protein [Peptoniphilus sp.]|nr:NYN domain-containing protein [Peptoniphilus sp.]MDY3118140.1 NYN domain-containing protein [Peptoniphilus sp.]